MYGLLTRIDAQQSQVVTETKYAAAIASGTIADCVTPVTRVEETIRQLDRSHMAHLGHAAAQG
jgi:hypothetical protein